MSRSLNYSKWDRIEVSDDEKDAHPNIDSSLMIRIKREQRARREAEELKEIAELRRLGTPEALAKIDEIRGKSKLHVDNICRVVDEKTIVNRGATQPAPAPSASSSHASQISEEDEFEEFVEKHERVIMEYSQLDSFEKSEEFLLQHVEILNDHACGWLLLHQLALEMSGERVAMLAATRQYLMLRNIMDLANEVKSSSDPRPMVKLFFKQVSGDKERKVALDRETETFAQQIINRAIQKKQEMNEHQRIEEAH